MMRHLFLGAALLFAAMTAQAEDDRFVYHPLFGSEGFGNPILTQQDRNDMVFRRLWESYCGARKYFDRPIPKAAPGGYSQAEVDEALSTSRNILLLRAMVELRAFAVQNEYDKVVLGEMQRINRVLVPLRLEYRADGRDGIDGLCSRLGVQGTRQILAPVLKNDDGSEHVPTLQK